MRPGATQCEMGLKTGAAISHSPATPVCDSIAVNLVFDADYLLQRVDDFDQIALRFHDLVDFLLSHRRQAQTTLYTQLMTPDYAVIARTLANSLDMY